MIRPSTARALVHIGKSVALAAVAEDPATFEVERPGRPFGLWVDLGSVTPERLTSLIELAWQARTGKDPDGSRS